MGCAEGNQPLPFLFGMRVVLTCSWVAGDRCGALETVHVAANGCPTVYPDNGTIQALQRGNSAHDELYVPAGLAHLLDWQKMFRIMIGYVPMSPGSQEIECYVRALREVPGNGC